MAPAGVDDMWSDSDEELEAADVETAVQLGVPDGPLASPADLSDPTISRLGGHPTFLAAPHPSLAYATCNHCSQAMELLIQIWCPLEGSPNDRALFVWGCANGICQRKEGSVRAWRELRYNRKYAEKLEKKLARLKDRDSQEAKDAMMKKTPFQSNPFAMDAASSPTPLGLGSQIFGGPSLDSSSGSSTLDSQTESPDRDGSPRASTESESEGEDSEDETEDALAAAVQSTSLEDSPWKDAPGYPPLYLSTVSEYLPAPPKVKMPAEATVDLDGDRHSKEKDSGGWGLKGYENSMEVDHAFERFSKRVSYEGEQCLRYELKGTPLPYARDEIFNKLFPMPLAPPLPVTKSSFMVTPARKRTYAPKSLPVCPHCRSPRVFECQLMPNLINVLGSNQVEAQRTMTDEERRAEVLEALKGQGTLGCRGMEWGTCMIFSCGKDCAMRHEAGSTWREEYVLVQWDASM
ncbi:programmed cell death protein 2 [Ganoderma leucocontextum]|nr:programmed cell death protein 2 [Ganoderma leucocontextum]